MKQQTLAVAAGQAAAYELVAVFPVRVERGMLQVRDNRFDPPPSA